MLVVHGDPVKLGCATFRVFSRAEADDLETQMKRRNTFVRHYAGRDSYSKKIAAFADASVLLLEKPATNASTPENMRLVAEQLERLMMLGVAYGVPRRKLQRHLAVGVLGGATTDLYMAGGLRDLSTKTAMGVVHQPLVLDASAARRLRKLGLHELAERLAEPGNDTCSRAARALGWLWESRLERQRPAAFVKTTIGFETLFVYDASEPPRRTIAERLAFLLGRTPEQRAAIAKLARSLYDDRSAVVHGGNREVAGSEANLDRADRILLLAALALAHNAKSAGALRDWFEGLRWSMSTVAPELPFSAATLNRALG